MLTVAENERLTRVGPGTPMGELMRRYWQPVALSREVGADPVPLRILGEDLVLFRDGRGRLGLVARACAHRGTDLSYGRIEPDGLRCIYHGWLYEGDGRCLEQPGEPPGSDFAARVRQPGYPCREYGDLIFAYLGPGEPPQIPAYEPLTVPSEHRFVRKFVIDCNYLQANEANLDVVHLSFLHRQLEGTAERLPLGVRGTAASVLELHREDVAPRYEVESTAFGLRFFSVRQAGGRWFVKVMNFVLPNLCAVPGETGGDGYLINWHVPIDDVTHIRFAVNFRRSGPLPEAGRQRMESSYRAQIGPDFRLLRNAANRYLQDREEMRREWFSGLGAYFAVHDACASESPGAIQDRTQEHLAASDKPIAAARHVLRRALRDLEAGRRPPHVLTDPAQAEVREIVVVSAMMPLQRDWRTDWRDYA